MNNAINPEVVETYGQLISQRLRIPLDIDIVVFLNNLILNQVESAITTTSRFTKLDKQWLKF